MPDTRREFLATTAAGLAGAAATLAGAGVALGCAVGVVEATAVLAAPVGSGMPSGGWPPALSRLCAAS